MNFELASIGLNDAIANGRSRRRFGPSTASSTKTTTSEVTEKSKTDQVVAASSHTEPSQYRRGGAYSTDAGDYSYNNADLNLIRPESKPLHTKITAKYTSSISIPSDSLEDTETAEEYVAKAMGMYGSRLREPIRIPSEPEVEPSQRPHHYQQHHTAHHHAAPAQQELQQQHEQLQHQQQLQQQQEQYNHQQFLQQHQHQHEQEQEQEQQHLQNLHEAQEKPQQYDYYSFSHKDTQRPIIPVEEESQSPAPPQYHYASAQEQNENEAAKALLEAQMQAQLQEQMQQAQIAAKEHEKPAQPQQQQQSEQANEESGNYEKDPVTRSYNIYEDHTEGYDGSNPAHLERNYRTKYLYKPASSSYLSSTASNENEEKIRVSASTEIPKAEIMKQIEKSVMKYMKELEAEGKIVAAPKSHEPKTYFKVVTIPGTDEKHIASSTYKPKYTSSGNNYGEGYKHTVVHAPAAPAPSSSQAGHGQKYSKNAVGNKNSYLLENENVYQNSGHDVTDVLAPNVEFIYKIKTKAPLHTATVKTVSKPYSLPIKNNFEQFDHSTALKNLEEFDLSHVVTTPDPEDHQSISPSTSKPSKLYFNSEIYHDINSMPYKQKPRSENEYRPEYRKKTSSQEPHPDYKGYSGVTSGYYAEPPTGEAERDMSSSGMSEDGYPVMNPYQQYVLKKEAMPSKYEEASSSFEQPRSHKYKSLEFDSYNPKYNNNPEGYGYQQTYKTHLTSRHAPGKRGKRGGAPHPSQSKKSIRNSSMKEFEANVALRPPPKV
ncbi:probable serine/threonine-protein kinase DDB_G0280133 [Stomoxys calcitrans]|uniref:probable serine/threonine-protein kinase DDB_G0280133 n=1 Tax=Stomoxys calcitrans TaxID=35570 RepID=UPI0027E27205|nr:probable serine/threonine-protein kinase DDB_G0280133 [Stomoxys calcitrans]